MYTDMLAVNDNPRDICRTLFNDIIPQTASAVDIRKRHMARV